MSTTPDYAAKVAPHVETVKTELAAISERCHREGAAAKTAGKPRTAVPYKWGTVEWVAWDEGWERADAPEPVPEPRLVAVAEPTICPAHTPGAPGAATDAEARQHCGVVEEMRLTVAAMRNPQAVTEGLIREGLHPCESAKRVMAEIRAGSTAAAKGKPAGANPHGGGYSELGVAWHEGWRLAAAEQ